MALLQPIMVNRSGALSGALPIVVGVMTLWWVAALAAFVLIEKVVPAGPAP